ncbi:hypothetical protein V6N13_054218 [Hibiscus sabdariffa]
MPFPPAASTRDAIGDSDFFLVARTDACATLAKTGLHDPCTSCSLYRQEQMHRGTMTSLRRSDAVPEGTESVIWIMIEGGVTPLHTPEEHKAMGFHLIVHPLTALYASARISGCIQP